MSFSLALSPFSSPQHPGELENPAFGVPGISSYLSPLAYRHVPISEVQWTRKDGCYSSMEITSAEGDELQRFREVARSRSLEPIDVLQPVSLGGAEEPTWGLGSSEPGHLALFFEGSVINSSLFQQCLPCPRSRDLLTQFHWGWSYGTLSSVHRSP
jgi:hypothetical protein